MFFRKLIVLFICVFSQLSLSKAAEQDQKVETLVMFFHGMGQRAQEWEDGYSQFIKGMYKSSMPSNIIEKGTLVVDFPEGDHDFTSFMGKGKQWFKLPATFKNDAKEIKTEAGLLSYLDPQGSGLMQSTQRVISHIDNLLTQYEITTDNLVLMGYSQGGMIASMVSQYLDGDCRSLIMINAPYVPDQNAISKAQKAYLTYGTKDALIPQHVYEISAQALTRELGDDNVVIKVLPGVKHDPDMGQQAIFIFETINATLKEIKTIR